MKWDSDSFLEGDKIFQRGPKISSKSDPGGPLFRGSKFITTGLALQLHSSLQIFKTCFCVDRVGIGLDTYMMPVEDGIEDKVEQPLLFINSWTWQWPKNVIKMKRIVDTDPHTDDSKLPKHTHCFYPMVTPNRVPHPSTYHTSVCQLKVFVTISYWSIERRTTKTKLMLDLSHLHADPLLVRM